MHDRLGSVRLLIDDTGTVKKSYTFDPFGNLLESYDDGGNIENNYLFTGQFFDNEINQYYLRARQYDPELQRFTSIDPIRGNFQEPITLHQYLYCLNNPINNWDTDGEFSITLQTGREGLTGYLRAVNWQRVLSTGIVAVRNIAITAAVYYVTYEAMLSAFDPTYKPFSAQRSLRKSIGRNNPPPSGWQKFFKNLKDPYKWGPIVGGLFALHASLRGGCDTSEWDKIFEDVPPDFGPEDTQIEPDREPDKNWFK